MCECKLIDVYVYTQRCIEISTKMCMCRGTHKCIRVYTEM